MQHSIQQKVQNKMSINSNNNLIQQNNNSINTIVSFRSKTQKALQIINKHQKQKYNFLKTLTNNNQKKKFNYFMNQFQGSKDNDTYYSFIEIPQIKIQQNIKVQLLPYTQQIYKLNNPFYEMYRQINKWKEEDQNKIITKYNINEKTNQDIKLSNKNSQKYTNEGQKLQKTQNILKKKNQMQIEDLTKSLIYQKVEFKPSQNKLKIYIKNYHGTMAQLFIYFQSNNSTQNIQIQSINKQRFKTYSYKYLINNPKIINIQMDQSNIKKNNIYFRIKSQSQLSMFTLRIQKEHKLQIRKKLKTEIQDQLSLKKSKQNKKQLKFEKIKSISLVKNKINYIQENNNQISKTRSFSLKQLSKVNKQSIFPLIESQNNFQSKFLNKEKLKTQFEKLKQEQKNKKKQQQKIKAEQIRKKKQAIEVSKLKQLQLRKMAIQMKRLVQAYKIFHDNQIMAIKKVIPSLAVLMFLPRFHHFCNQLVNGRQKGLQIALKTRRLTKKFVKLIKKKYRQAIQNIKQRKNRQMISLINMTGLLGKILFKQTLQKAFQVANQTIKNCQTGLIMNHTFDYATIYRRKVRFIQRTWVSIYHARMTMFKLYIHDQLIQLFKKYPHFKQLQLKFNKQNVAHYVAYKYISDQSSKVKYLFEQYFQKISQIQQFQQMNKKIKEFNSTALKKRQKQYLQIPKTPCKPTQRYFRNLSFLKGLIRGWFEVQYRKIAKAIKVQKDRQKQKQRTDKKMQKISTKILNNKDFQNQINQIQKSQEKQKLSKSLKKINDPKNQSQFISTNYKK